MLPNRIYVVSDEAVKKLREASMQFTALSFPLFPLPYPLPYKGRFFVTHSATVSCRVFPGLILRKQMKR